MGILIEYRILCICKYAIPKAVPPRSTWSTSAPCGHIRSHETMLHVPTKYINGYYAMLQPQIDAAIINLIFHSHILSWQLQHSQGYQSCQWDSASRSAKKPDMSKTFVIIIPLYVFTSETILDFSIAIIHITSLLGYSRY